MTTNGRNKKKCLVAYAFHDYADQPFDRFGLGLPVVFIADRAKRASYAACKSKVVYLDNYQDAAESRRAVLALAETHDIQAIFARAERDVLRAALLREELGIGGLHFDEARLFRDKYRMYRRLSPRGIPIPPYRKLTGSRVARAFVKQHGPSIVKPCFGSGSLGVETVREESELWPLLPHLGREELLIQKFCDGEMYHLDGVWTGESVRLLAVSRYLGTCLAFKEDGFLGSALQDPAGLPLDAYAAAQKVCAGFGVRKPFVFHLELFVRGKEWLFCEIACRPGGSRIVPTLALSSGYQLDHVLASLELNKTPRALPKYLPRQTAAGFLIVPPRAGRVRRIAYPKRARDIRELRISPLLKEKQGGATKSGDYLLTYVVTGRSPAAVERRLARLGTGISQSIVMEK